MRKFKPQQLDNSTIREAKRLLDLGCTKAYVRQKLDIGRGSVDRIAAGTLVAEEEEGHTRCGGCGGMQEMPCRVCENRALVAA